MKCWAILYLRRTQYLHALFVYIFLAFLRGSRFKGQNNTLIFLRSQASKCPTQLTVDRGSVDLIVWEWWRRSLNLVCLCAPWSNNGPHCLTVSLWEMLSRRRGPSTLPRHPVIRTQTRGRIAIRSGGGGEGSKHQDIKWKIWISYWEYRDLFHFKMI